MKSPVLKRQLQALVFTLAYALWADASQVLWPGAIHRQRMLSPSQSTKISLHLVHQTDRIPGAKGVSQKFSNGVMTQLPRGNKHLISNTAQSTSTLQTVTNEFGKQYPHNNSSSSRDTNNVSLRARGLVSGIFSKSNTRSQESLQKRIAVRTTSKSPVDHTRTAGIVRNSTSQQGGRKVESPFISKFSDLLSNRKTPSGSLYPTLPSSTEHPPRASRKPSKTFLQRLRRSTLQDMIHSSSVKLSTTPLSDINTILPKYSSIKLEKYTAEVPDTNGKSTQTAVKAELSTKPSFDLSEEMTTTDTRDVTQATFSELTESRYKPETITRSSKQTVQITPPPDAQFGTTSTLILTTIAANQVTHDAKIGTSDSTDSQRSSSIKRSQKTRKRGRLLSHTSGSRASAADNLSSSDQLGAAGQSGDMPVAMQAQPQAPASSGLICYGDAMKIAIQDVDCPLKLVKRSVLKNHHLEQLLRSQGESVIPGIMSSTIPSEFFESEIPQEDEERYRQNSDHISSLAQEHRNTNTKIRKYVRNYLRLPASKDVISLTDFLGSRVSSGNKPGSCLFPHHPVCMINSTAIGMIKSLQDKLDDEIFDKPDFSSETDDVDEIVKQMVVNDLSSQKLIELISKLETAIANLSNVLMDMKESFIPVLVTSSQQHIQLTKTSPNASTSTSPFLSEGFPPQHTKSSVSHQPIKENTNASLKEVGENLDNNTHNRKSFDKRDSIIEENQNSDVNNKSMLGPSNSGLYENHSQFIIDILQSIEDKLLILKDTLKENDYTADVHSLLSYKTLHAIQGRDEIKKFGRTKRAAGTGTQPLCSTRGSPVDGNYLRLCSTCFVRTDLGASIFPRYVNEKVCDGANVNSQGSSATKGCLNESSPDRPTAGGRCQQQKMQIKVLKRNSNRCMKVLSHGKEIITDQWKLTSIDLKTGCECQINKNSKFASYVAFT